MNNHRILVTDSEFDDLSQKLITEVHSLPLYNMPARREAAKKYLKEVQAIIVKNSIQQLAKYDAKSVSAEIIMEILAGPQ